MPRHRFKLFCNGLFHSKLSYCLQVFGNVWDIPDNDDETRRFAAFTKLDNNKLQILQNKVMRLKTNLPFHTSTKDLCRTSGDLSVQQLTAFSSLTTLQKCIFHQKPEYMAERSLLRSSNQEQTRQNNSLRNKAKLTLTRGGFMYRSSALFNNLPDHLRSPMEPGLFRTNVKQWVKSNIAVKPG